MATYGLITCEGLNIELIEEFEHECESFVRLTDQPLLFNSHEPIRYFRSLVALGVLRAQPKIFVMAVAYAAALIENNKVGWNHPTVKGTVQRIVDHILPSLETDQRGVVFVEVVSAALMIKPAA